MGECSGEAWTGYDSDVFSQRDHGMAWIRIPGCVTLKSATGGTRNQGKVHTDHDPIMVDVNRTILNNSSAFRSDCLLFFIFTKANTCQTGQQLYIWQIQKYSIWTQVRITRQIQLYGNSKRPLKLKLNKDY